MESVDGIIADLGVSFHHFDEASRGFSFRADAPLDMRMNRSAALTASQVINTYSDHDLARVLRLWGDLRKPGSSGGSLLGAAALAGIVKRSAPVPPISGE